MSDWWEHMDKKEYNSLRKTAGKGILAAMCLGVSLDKTAKLPDAGAGMVFVREVMLSFSSDKVNMLLAALACMALCYGATLFLKEKKVSGVSMLRIIACLFALGQLGAAAYKTGDSLTFLWSRPVVALRAALLLAGYYSVAFWILVLLAAVFGQRRQAGAADTAKGALPYMVPEANVKHVSVRKRMKKTAWYSAIVPLLLAWLPYEFIFYPGTANEDSIIQIMEFFHIKSYIHDITAVQGADVFLTNHHPYLLTMLFGGFAKLGVLLGNVRIGFVLYILLHMVFLAAVFSTGLWYLEYIGQSKKAAAIAKYILMFLPIFPMYAICMVKDTLYSGFFLLLTMALFEIVRTGGEILDKRRFCILLGAAAMLLMMTKVYGKYVMVLLAVVCLFCYRSYWKRLLLSMVLPVVLFQFFYLGWLLPALHVAPGGVQEGLSVPFQQTARYLKEYPTEVLPWEKEAIDGVLPADELAKLYDPQLSNDVKEQYNQQATPEERTAYFKAWLSMGLRHPLCYLDATWNNVYAYFDMDKTSYLGYTRVHPYLQRHEKRYPAGEYGWLYIENPKELAGVRYAVSQMILLLQKVPILNGLLSMGLLPYILLFLFYLNEVKRRRAYHLLLLMPALTVGICLLSPENGNCRYVMPLMFLQPYLWGMGYDAVAWGRVWRFNDMMESIRKEKGD